MMCGSVGIRETIASPNELKLNKFLPLFPVQMYIFISIFIVIPEIVIVWILELVSVYSEIYNSVWNNNF